MQHPESVGPREQMREVVESHAERSAAQDQDDAAVPTFAPDAADGVAELSYEQARDELVAVVRQLESGDLPLERALDLWRRGEALADHCQSWLDGARRALDEARAANGSAAPGADAGGAGSGSAERLAGSAATTAAPTNEDSR